MALLRLLSATSLALAATLGLAACEEEGPAEQLGEQVDESTEEAGEAIEEAGEEAEDAAN